MACLVQAVTAITGGHRVGPRGGGLERDLARGHAVADVVSGQALEPLNVPLDGEAAKLTLPVGVTGPATACR